MTPELFTANDYLVAAELETGVAAARLLEIVPRERLLLALFAPYAWPDGTLRERSLAEVAAALAVSLAREELLVADDPVAGELPAGDLPAGDLPADDSLAGDPPAGEWLRAGANGDVAVRAMAGFLAKNGRNLAIAHGDGAPARGPAIELVERVLAGEASEADLAAWVAERIV
jgi:hypothetical protein